MGFRLIPIGGAGTHEGIATRGTHKVAVTGNLCALLNACEEARAHAVLAEDGVALQTIIPVVSFEFIRNRRSTRFDGGERPSSRVSRKRS